MKRRRRQKETQSLYKSIRLYLSHSLSLSASSATALSIYAHAHTHRTQNKKQVKICVPRKRSGFVVRENVIYKFAWKKCKKVFAPLSKGKGPRKKRSPFPFCLCCKPRKKNLFRWDEMNAKRRSLSLEAFLTFYNITSRWQPLLWQRQRSGAKSLCTRYD